MDEPILARWAPRTKLIRPTPADDVVLDDALVERAVGLINTKPFTLMKAPAGSGKTTLAAAAAARVGACAWARVDDLDDDPATLLELLVLAIEGVAPDSCPAARQLLQAGLPTAMDPRQAAAVLVNDLLDAGAHVAVVIDDLHTLQSPATLGALDYFIDHLPPDVHLVATARTEPALSLARWRARNALGDIGPDDLRLSPRQAEAILNERMGLDLPPDMVAKLVDAASGWVTGVRLLGQSQDAVDAFIGAELVDNEREDVRRFLFDTAVLDVLTPSSCGALTGRTDTAVVLDDLARRHSLFVLPVDPAGPAYRYHDLLRSFLLRRLATTDPVRLAMLHQAAAAAEPVVGRRIEHLLAAEAWDDAADAIESIAEPFGRPVDIRRLDGWIQQLPDEVRQGRLRLVVLSGLAAAQRGDVTAAIAALDPVVDELEASGHAALHWVAVRTLHIMTNDHGRYVPVLMRLEHSPVFAQLPPAAQTDHHISSSYGALFTGGWDETARRIELAIGVATATADVGAVEVLAQHLGPLLAGASGAVAHIAAFAEWTDAHFPVKPPLVQLGLHHQRSLVAFFRAELDRAAAEARPTLELDAMLGGYPFRRATAEWVLAATALARGDVVAAEGVLRGALDDPNANDLDRVLHPLRMGLLARVLRHQGRVDELGGLVERLDAMGPSPFADQLAWAQGTTRVQWHWAAGRLDQAAAAARETVPVESRARVIPFLVSPRLDLALVLDTMGRADDARTELAGALASFAGWGTAGLACVGPEIVPLLRQMSGATAAAALRALDVDALPSPVAVPGTPEVLSGREVEVLRLLDKGASNKDIAQALVVSENTVKTHIKNVLAKLGAHSRGEAAAAARRHHLL